MKFDVRTVIELKLLKEEINNMKTIQYIILILFGGFSGQYIYNYTNKNINNRPNSTRYQVVYNGEILNCNMMTMTKNCANLSDCDDKNSYFCVSNVKMFVDKK